MGDLRLFKEFLLREIQKRNMSIREFATWLGVSNTVINRYVDPNGTTYPSVPTVALIAKKTGTPIDVLFKMIYPDIDDDLLRFDAQTMSIAQQITQLSPEKREIVEAFILGTLLQQSNKSE